jgi:hypothetical protein
LTAQSHRLTASLSAPGRGGERPGIVRGLAGAAGQMLRESVYRRMLEHVEQRKVLPQRLPQLNMHLGYKQ